MCEAGIDVGEVELFDGRMFGLGRTWSGCRGLGLTCSSRWFWLARTAAASNSFPAESESSAVCRSQIYWITFVMTSSFESLRFFGMKGTRSLSLLMYI